MTTAEVVGTRISSYSLRDNDLILLCILMVQIYGYDCRCKSTDNFRKIMMIVVHIMSKLNSVALVHKQTIPTERPPLVGEVSANFCG
jgi:hypothetical protein